MGAVSRRSYDSTGREEAARRTRRRILDAAHALLVDEGFAGLTIAGLAQAAEVSPQTIYNSIGGKAAVLKACYDVTLAGDDEPRAMSERPEFTAMSRAATGAQFLAAYASWCHLVSGRVAPIVGPLLRGGSGDAGVTQFITTIEGERRTGTTHAMTALRDRYGVRRGLTLERAVDIAWTLNAPEVYERLVVRSGWSGRAYRAWLAQQLECALLD